MRTEPTHDVAAPLNVAEAAEYLNVSERYVRRLVAERRVAYHKLGRLLRFRPADLDRLLDAGRIELPRPHPLLAQRGTTRGTM